MTDTNESLLKFPCDFPIKVMGKSHPDFTETITTIVRQFDPAFDASKIETRPSSSGNYTGLTVTVHVVSREQLDEVYRALTGHPMVSVVL